MTLTDLIFQNNKEDNRECILQEGLSYSYSNLFQNIQPIREFLENKLNSGERVGILCENSIEYVSSYLASICSDFVAVPINTLTYSTELEYIVNDCQIKAILTSSKFFENIGSSARKYLISEILKEKSSNPYKQSNIDKNKLATLMYTSGSTGKPNAVKITHKNLLANTMSIIKYLSLKMTDRTMVVLPFYYCYGASLMHTALVSGGSLVINNFFMFPQKVVNEMREKKCTIFAGVPSTYKILINRTKLAESDTSLLRYALQAGGRLPPSDLLKLHELLPKTKIIVMYGQTEATSRLSYLPFEFFESKLGSVGKGIPGVELQVVNEQGKCVKEGKIGEIRVRGDNISLGYWNRPEESKKTFRDGWLYTGDMAKIDKDGFIYVVGRNKDFIKAGGNRFSAVEIEDIISTIDGIENVAAVGVYDDLLGEAVHVFVVSRNKSIKEKDIIDLCSRKLPSYKVPKKVTFMKELPLNAFGKVQKFRLIRNQ